MTTSQFDPNAELRAARAAPGNGIIDRALPWLDASRLSDQQRDEAVAHYVVSAHYRLGNRKDLPPDALAVAPYVLRLIKAEMIPTAA